MSEMSFVAINQTTLAQLEHRRDEVYPVFGANNTPSRIRRTPSSARWT
jgi:hypothetical protein